MRVTAEVKHSTRERLLRVARRLFASRGFTRTTTRDIAAKAGLAPGTPFNYFRTKEALATALFAGAAAAAREPFLAERQPCLAERQPCLAERQPFLAERQPSLESRRARASLTEDLFAHALAELKALQPFRSYCAEVFATALSPFAPEPEVRAGDELRRGHLDAVATLLARHRVDPAPTTLQLYWTLHLGVLAAWSRPGGDDEEILALLDRTLRLFVAAVTAEERAR